MRRSMLLAGAVVLLSGSAAFAQTTVTTTTTRTLDMPAQQEVVVRDYVTRQHPAPVVIERHMTVRPGSIIPEDVELHPLRALGDPDLARYDYFVSPDHKIVIVDPGSREVLRIIDQAG